MCVSTDRPCPTTLLALYSGKVFVGTLKIVFTLWFTCTLLYCHIPNIYVLCSSVASFSVKAIRLPCMSIHILTLVDLKRITTDLSFHSVLWCEVTFLSTFLSPYTEIAWWFLVWQTWDIFLRDLAQEWLIFITCKSFHFYFTLVVAINLVTCLSYLNIERLIEDIDAH